MKSRLEALVAEMVERGILFEDAVAEFENPLTDFPPSRSTTIRVPAKTRPMSSHFPYDFSDGSGILLTDESPHRISSTSLKDSRLSSLPVVK